MAISRGIRRQVLVLVLPLRREVFRLRRRVGELQSTLKTLRRSAAGWKRLMDAAPTVPHVSEEEAKAARLSPRLVQSLRRRLGLSQMALARLTGVSAPAVGHWEAGESTPTGRNRVTLVALRKVRRREVHPSFPIISRLPGPAGSADRRGQSDEAARRGHDPRQR